MSRLLRSDLDELDAYVTQIAAATGIPAAHIEKDYWVTEVLRGVAAASHETRCSIVFKGVGATVWRADHAASSSFGSLLSTVWPARVLRWSTALCALLDAVTSARVFVRRMRSHPAR